LADRWKEDEEGLNAAARAVVRNPDDSEDHYRQALRWAEKACQIRAVLERSVYVTNGAVAVDHLGANRLTTAGAAQYRLGQYKEARETLWSATALHGQEASSLTLALQAMAEFRLGQKEHAKNALDQSRRLLDPPSINVAGWSPPRSWDSGEEVRSFVREAEELIEGKRPEPNK
jgi:Flp pilus assembly protein TadD